MTKDAGPEDHRMVEAFDRTEHLDALDHRYSSTLAQSSTATAGGHLTRSISVSKSLAPISTGTLPCRHERSAASSARTTCKPNRPSERGCPPSMHWRKWSTSFASGSSTATYGAT